MTGIEVLISALVCTVILLVIFAEPNQVPQDERWVMTVFGKYFRTLSPGLQFTIRWIEKIATTRQAETETVPTSTTEVGQVELIKEVGIDERYKKTPKGIRSTRTYVRYFLIKNTITKDGVVIPEIQCQISNRMMAEGDETLPKDSPIPDYVYRNTFVLGAPMGEALMGLVNGTVRSVIARYEFPEILDEPDSIKTEIEKGMREEMKLWGEHLNRLLIAEFVPPDDIQKSLQEPFKAKKTGEALVATATQKALEATQEKKAKITSAEGEKQKIILDAEAQKQREILEAESKAMPLQKVAKIFGWRKNGDPALKLRTSQSAADYMTIDDRTRAAVELGKGDGTVIFHDGQNGLLEGAVGVMGKVFRKIEANEELQTKPS